MVGEIGEPIPGSRFVKDVCERCGAPIRVSPNSVIGKNRCSNCPGTVRDQIQARERESPHNRLGRKKTDS